MKEDVLLFSGGPDSFIAWEYLSRKPDCLYVRHNCMYEEKQLKAINEIRNSLPEEDRDKIDATEFVIDIGAFEKDDAEIPLRNMYLCMIAASMGYSKIYIVLQQGERSIPDRTEDFLQRLSSELSIQLGREIEITNPFFGVTKQDMVKWYVDNGSDFDINILKKTVSCFHPVEPRCGMCSACFRRWIAFEYNDIHEDHFSDITKWIGVQEYIKKLNAGEYDEKRTRQTLEVLKGFDLV